MTAQRVDAPQHYPGGTPAVTDTAAAPTPDPPSARLPSPPGWYLRPNSGRLGWCHDGTIPAPAGRIPGVIAAALGRRLDTVTMHTSGILCVGPLGTPILEAGPLYLELVHTDPIATGMHLGPALANPDRAEAPYGWAMHRGSYPALSRWNPDAHPQRALPGAWERLTQAEAWWAVWGTTTNQGVKRIASARGQRRAQGQSLALTRALQWGVGWQRALSRPAMTDAILAGCEALLPYVPETPEALCRMALGWGLDPELVGDAGHVALVDGLTDTGGGTWQEMLAQVDAQTGGLGLIAHRAGRLRVALAGWVALAGAASGAAGPTMPSDTHA